MTSLGVKGLFFVVVSTACLSGCGLGEYHENDTSTPTFHCTEAQGYIDVLTGIKKILEDGTAAKDLCPKLDGAQFKKLSEMVAQLKRNADGDDLGYSQKKDLEAKPATLPPATNALDQRLRLYGAIWKVANELQGDVDLACNFTDSAKKIDQYGIPLAKDDTALLKVDGLNNINLMLGSGPAALIALNCGQQSVTDAGVTAKAIQNPKVDDVAKTALKNTSQSNIRTAGRTASSHQNSANRARATK